MKVLLSPAMNMEEKENELLLGTVPLFYKEANFLAEQLQKLSPFELESNLGISTKLVDRVFDYYCNFDLKSTKKGSKAILSFYGLAYKNLNVEDFTKEDFDFANNTLRILSGMYGILKPSDIIQQYRLDFMCDFSKKGIIGNTLYDYWGSCVYNEVFKDNELVIAICSKEYEKLIKPFLRPNNNYISCEFLVNKKGKFKALATASKMARGQMARYIIKNKIDNIEKIKDFEFDGYVYREDLSNEGKIVFIK